MLNLPIGLEQLTKKFKIICCIDLADVNQSHSAIYKLFSKHRKDYFEPRDRLIFYSCHRPSDALIGHIYRAAELVDISSCFIMICGPHDINRELQLLSRDSTCIEYFNCDVEAKQLQLDHLLDEQTLCPLPWMHLMVSNLGACQSCCINKTRVGSIIDHDLESLFHSDKMQQLRASMLAGEKHEDCSMCWSLEDQNFKSSRQWHMEFYAKDFFSNWLDDVQLRSLDFRPSNVCNFKCRICNPGSSSLFANEQMQLATSMEKITELKTINFQSRWFDDNEKFLHQFVKLLPNLINIDFLGGEPFLLKQLPKLLEIALTTGHSQHIKIHFATNGSIFPVELIEHLNSFKEIDIALSIDNVGKRFEYERGGNWSQVEQNIKQWQTQTKFQLAIFPAVNVQNVYYLDELIAWADAHSLRVLFNYVVEPSYFNIDNMPNTAKKLVIEKYKNHSHAELRNLAKRLESSATSDGKNFVEFMQTLDRHRNQNFAESHKEIAFAMGYSL